MVKAVETSLRELLEGAKQYQVPLYQRTYAWTSKQLGRLWDDIAQLAEDRATHGPQITHFLGSLVLGPTPDVGPVGVSKYLVVDGQQRLTTTTLLLAAIRDHRAATESPEHRDRINEQYLVNKWKTGDERLKLLPTQADRASYLACIESTPLAGAADQIGEAYRYFRARVAELDDPDDPHDVERIEEAVLSGLTLVSVTTTRDDNAHRIFESLNNTGLRLTQGDLLRNYLFMRLPSRGPLVYKNQWLPLQERLSNDELELLFWLDAVQRDESVTQGDTYRAQAARMDALVGEAAIEAEVERFNALSLLMERILRPETERHPAVRERLTRLKEWGTTTVYPLLLHLLDRRRQGSTTDDEIARAMLYLESYLVRRVVTNRATAGLNRVLLRAVPEIAEKAPVDAAFRTYLSTGRKFFATDDQVRAAARTVPLYYSGRSNQRKLVLAWLEEDHEARERVDVSGCTIEHVLPQTLTPAWKDMLAAGLEEGESVDDAHAVLVHTLGNLTLTAYNSELGNQPFATKRAEYAKSGLRMNREIAEQETWGRAQIEQRADALAERILRLWPGPDERAQPEPIRESWGLMNRALAELPPGAWTTYGAVAQLIGSHPVPVGHRIANHPVPNGHRVLQTGGTVSPGFRWLAESGRTESQREALEAEGVRFDESGRADPAQCFSAEDLAVLAGVDPGEVGPPSRDQVRETSFWSLLSEHQDEATVAAIGHVTEVWRRLGGELEYGSAAETSCFLVTKGPAGYIWPLVIYPSYGRAEVVFQYLLPRPPFDDVALRNELRLRLNEMPDVDLPESKLALRPSFELRVLTDERALSRLIAALEWFVAQLHAGVPEGQDGATAQAPDGDWYVSFGHGQGRSWDDAREYGFICAGGGSWYSRTLRGVPVGARVFVHVGGRGYVAVGRTLREARPFDEAEVRVEGEWRRVADLSLGAPYRHDRDDADAAGDDLTEYVIPVEWEHAVDLEQAYWEPGMFANQHSACPLTHAFTRARLIETMGLDRGE